MEYHVHVLLVAMALVTCVTGHGYMILPPARNALWRVNNNQYNVPVNTNDMALNCGGQGVAWGGVNTDGRGHCGICGDTYNAARPRFEAGGEFATGIIPQTYTEGQIITVVLVITVTHGGWSEFRLCANNNVHRTATQDCLDKHLLQLPGGATRFYHPAHTGNVTVHLVLPKGLKCSQCVMQWWWKTNSNNNCQPITGKDCCIACGRQELFVNCADVAITSMFKPPVVQTIAPAIPTTTRAPPIITHAVPTTASPTTAVPKTNRPANNMLPDRFLPIENKSTEPGVPSIGSTGLTPHVSGFWPIDIGSEKCAGTKLARGLYGRQLADRWCQSQCALGTCPVRLCTEACRG